MIKIKASTILLIIALFGLIAVGAGGVTYIITSKVYKEKIVALQSELSDKQKSLQACQEALSSKTEGISCRDCHKNVDFHSPEELKAKNKDARICSNCHEDVHVVHKAQPCEICHMGKEETATFTFPHPEKGKLLVCENCHDSDYLEIHKDIPSNCQACHKGDVLSYHSKNYYMQAKISDFLNKAVS
ncbi:MAG: hypothetical protein DRN95_05285 [Candidatus Hydrothermarchaeota archaeon]|nr:MAG: hypothetical protein DRN95_05285 [Candidatus Hydrothermarchaeota archaeon]